VKITFSDFKGTAPKFDDEQLRDGYSVRSINTRSGRSILEPFKASSLLSTVQTTSPEAIFKYRNKWFSWTTPTFAVRAPIINDPYDYVLIASEGSEPKVSYNLISETGAGPYPTAVYPLGVPAPLAPISPIVADADGWVVPDVAPTEDEYDYSATAYALVYKDAWGRLSALSPPSTVVELREYNTENTNKVTFYLPTIPSALILTDSVRGTSATILVYRTNFAGAGLGVFQFVDEIGVSETSYSDDMFSGELLESPINEAWVGPPDTNTALYPNGPIEKFIIMGSDTIVGHNKKILCFAEPDAFYSFPVEYYKAFTEDIVTISPAGANAVILTTSYPYVVQGTHPASMSPTRLAEPVPCTSKNGVTEVAGAVYYVSTTGLYKITDYRLENISRDYMTEREWRALDPTTMVLSNYDGLVFVHCQTVGYSYTFNTYDPSDGMRKLDLDASAFSQLDETNDMAYVPSGTGQIVQFDSSTSGFRLAQWTSKTYDLQSPSCFSILKVRANQYPVTVTVEADAMEGAGIYEYEAVVENANFVYLPFESRSKHWRIKVDATNPLATLEVRDIQLADSPTELD
jgi:hypothetical protein